MRARLLLTALIALLALPIGGWRTLPGAGDPGNDVKTVNPGEVAYHYWASAVDPGTLYVGNCPTFFYQFIELTGTATAMPEACEPDDTNCGNLVLAAFATSGDYLSGHGIDYIASTVTCAACTAQIKVYCGR